MNRILPFLERQVGKTNDTELFVEALNDVLLAPVREVLFVGIHNHVSETRALWLSQADDQRMREAGYGEDMQMRMLNGSVGYSFTEEMSAMWRDQLYDCVHPTALPGLRDLATNFRNKILKRLRLMPRDLSPNLMTMWGYGWGLNDRRIKSSLIWLQGMAGKRPHIVPLGRWKQNPEVYILFFWGSPITVPAEHFEQP